MSFLSSNPFLKLVLPLCLGILVSVFWRIGVPFYGLGIAFIVFLLGHVLANRNRVFLPYFPYLVFVSIFVVGLFVSNQAQKKANLVSKISKDAIVIAELEQTPKFTDKTIKSNIQIVAVKTNDAWENNLAKSLLMLQKDSLSQQLKQGDKIIFKANFKPVPAQTNPNAFDYKQYLFFNGISHQVYLESNSWKVIKDNRTPNILTHVAQLRLHLLSLYKYYGIEGQALSVLSALTLGYKNDLDVEIQHSYVASGAIHILAVSGLHVGIVFVIITYLLSFLGKTRIQRLIRFLFVFVGLWLFAFLTGASPSVLRASLMFSFIALGQFLNRKNTIYNSIFASAFVLLLINPFLLFSLSFQLSYSAVLSIVYFQPKIHNLVVPKCKLTDKIWSLATVGIAAQIGTFPITIYYFHQFPNYFLISNFIVIPVATLAIWLSCIFFIFSALPFVAEILATILDQMIALQNYLILKLEQLPYALSKNLYIDDCQLRLLIISILLVVLLIETQKFKYAFSILLIFTGMGIYHSYNDWDKQHQHQILVYNVRGETAINLIQGQNHILMTTLDCDSKQIEFTMEDYWLSLGLNNKQYFLLKDMDKHFFLPKTIHYAEYHFAYRKQFFQFDKQRLLFLNSKDQLENISQTKMQLDYIIIGNNFMVPLDTILEHFEVSEIIVDSSHRNKSITHWQEQREINSEVDIHIVPIDGACIKNI